MERSRNGLAFTSLLIAFAVWSNAFIAISLLRQKFSALQLLEVRFIPAGLLGLAIAGLFYRRQVADMFRHHLVRLLIMGVLLIPVYNLILHYCLAYVTPSAGALFISFIPLFTMFLASDMLREPFTVSRAFGALIAFDGLFVVVLFGKVGGEAGVFMSLEQLPYALMIMFGCLAMALYTIIAKPLMVKYPPAAVNGVVLFVGSTPLWLGVNRELIDLTVSLTQLELWALGFLSVVCTIIAYQLWLLAVKYWKVSNVNLMSFIIPPLTAGFAYLYYGTPVSPVFALGGAVILAGVIFAISEDLQTWLREKTRNRARAKAAQKA